MSDMLDKSPRTGGFIEGADRDEKKPFALLLRIFISSLLGTIHSSRTARVGVFGSTAVLFAEGGNDNTPSSRLVQ